jgi:hypothetical protein
VTNLSGKGSIYGSGTGPIVELMVGQVIPKTIDGTSVGVGKTTGGAATEMGGVIGVHVTSGNATGETRRLQGSG